MSVPKKRIFAKKRTNRGSNGVFHALLGKKKRWESTREKINKEEVNQVDHQLKPYHCQQLRQMMAHFVGAPFSDVFNGEKGTAVMYRI